MYVCMYVCMYACMYVCKCVCMCACVCLYVCLCVVGRRVCMRVCVHQTLKMPTSCWLSLRGADTLTHNASQTSRSQTAAAAWTWTRLGTSANVEGVRRACLLVCMATSLYPCAHACVYMCVQVCLYICTCSHEHMYVCVHTHTQSVHVWMQVCTSVRSPCVRVCMFVVVYVCMYVCTYVCMSVCVRMRGCIAVPIKDLVETVAEVMSCTVRLVLSKEVVEASGRLQFARRVTPSVFLSVCPSL